MLETEKLDDLSRLSRLLEEMTHPKIGDPIPAKPHSLEYILCRDAEFITRLLTFDKAALAYGLLKYRHRWFSSESRAAALVGDLPKLGLLPALAVAAALIISAATLLKEDSNSFLWASLLTIFVIYPLMAFAVFLLRERHRQVIHLLEHAIQHVDQCNTAPSKAAKP